MQQVAEFISTLLSIYSFLIVVRIFLSWGNLGSARFASVNTFLTRITDPFLQLFRGLPGLQRGRLDLSPIVAMMVLGMVTNIFSILARKGSLTFGIFMAVIVSSIGSVLSFFLFILLILMGVRLYLEYRRTPNSIQFIAILDGLVGGITTRVHSIIFSGKEVPSSTLLIASTVTVAVINLLARFLFAWLTEFMVGLPF